MTTREKANPGSLAPAGPTKPDPAATWFPYLALAGCVALFLVLTAGSLLVKAPTHDEPNYLRAGRQLVERGDWETVHSVLHPPLTYYYHGALLSAVDAQVHSAGRLAPIFRALNINEHHAEFKIARLGMLSFGLLLIGGAWCWGRELYGPWAGALAAYFVALEPNLIGHGRLVTTDVAVAAFGLWAMCLVWRSFVSRGRAAVASAIGAAVALGAAMLSKYSGALLLPGVVAVGTIFVLCPPPSTEKANAQGPSARALGAAWRVVAVCGGAWVVLCLGYGAEGLGQAPALGDFKSAALVEIGSTEIARGAMAWVPRPYLLGVDFQQRINELGHPGFVMGQHFVGRHLLFMPVALLVKTPLALFGIVVFALVTLRSSARSLFDELCLLVPAVFFFGYVMFASNMTVAWRYVFPCLALALVWVSKVARAPLRTRASRVVLGIGVVGYGLVAIVNYPNYISYFNVASGLAGRPDEVLVDSNLDWGQDRFAAAEWATKASPGVRLNPTTPQVGDFLVRARFLQGLYSADPGRTQWLRDVIEAKEYGRFRGTHFFVTVRLDDLMRRVHDQPSNLDAAIDYALACREEARYAEAGKILERVVEEAPEYGRARWALGLVRMADGRFSEAELLFTRALAADRTHHEAARDLAFLYQLEGRDAEARVAERQATVARTLAGRTATHRGPSREEQSPARQLVAKGFDSVDAGLLDEAIAFFERARQLAPDLYPASANLAITARLQGDLARGVETTAAMAGSASLLRTDFDVTFERAGDYVLIGDSYQMGEPRAAVFGRSWRRGRASFPAKAMPPWSVDSADRGKRRGRFGGPRKGWGLIRAPPSSWSVDPT